jgi:hypothetical protein
MLSYAWQIHIQLTSNLPIAEAMHKQLQPLLFAGCHVHLIDIDQDEIPVPGVETVH